MAVSLAESPTAERVVTSGRPGAEPSPAAPASAAKPERLIALDAYRGFVMLLMASGGFAVARVVREHGGGEVWRLFAYELDHVAWRGCALWDLIQPSFMFMVGVAMPFSFASRQARGHGPWRNLAHVLWRSAFLVLLGIFLMSNTLDPTRRTHFTFVNVLTQIGLGYVVVYLFLGRGWKVQTAGIATILVGYWLFFALYTPGPEFDYPKDAGIQDASAEMTGLYAHWNKNSNAAAAFDRWFLNLFPPASRTDPQPFHFNEGGYQTLNFVPSMATMLFGLMAGELLRGPRSKRQKLLVLLAAGAACLALGWLLDVSVCPSIKRIWTPSWAVFSTGWTFLMLAGFFFVIDVAGLRRWAFPLVVVGMNSIAMYCMAQVTAGWVRRTLFTHLGPDTFTGFWGPIVLSVVVLAVLWLVCLWLYRRKVFLRI